MLLESLELRIARQKIERYQHDADKALIGDSEQAQDCLDCEAFLAGGIRALEWLERSENAIAEAVAEGVFDMRPELEDGLEALHHAWLRPCAFAEEWIASCQENGYEIKNLTVFRECCQRAREWTERNSLYKQSKAVRQERFAQEAW